jgi:hypothetical protein
MVLKEVGTVDTGLLVVMQPILVVQAADMVVATNLKAAADTATNRKEAADTAMSRRVEADMVVELRTEVHKQAIMATLQATVLQAIDTAVVRLLGQSKTSRSLSGSLAEALDKLPTMAHTKTAN